MRISFPLPTIRRMRLLPIICLVAACSSNEVAIEADYPKTDREARRERSGTLTGNPDGLILFGGNTADTQPVDNSGIGVNAYLWKAALDTVSFMPLASVDPFGGVIITDWHSPAGIQNERFKVNVMILDRALRSDGVKVTVFRQERKAADWQDATVATNTATDMENAILTRARQLRIAAERS